jgi:hypothetical protein
LNSPTPPPLPDFYIVENGLNYTKKGEKKHFTVQNRYGQFKMVGKCSNKIKSIDLFYI